MSEPIKIICPLCYAHHISMYMEGLSNTSGAMGMPAGNVANNNVELKCNACGHVFKPADGKLSQEPETTSDAYPMPAALTGTPHPIQGPDPDEVLRLLQTQGKLYAIKFVKDQTNWSLKESKEYVDSLDGSLLIPGQKKACFIATACYGDYDAPEVLCLRRYRDEVLATSLAGRTFIAMYYKLSPPLARWLSLRPRQQAWVRRYVLAPLLQHLDRMR